MTCTGWQGKHSKKGTRIHSLDSELTRRINLRDFMIQESNVETVSLKNDSHLYVDVYMRIWKKIEVLSTKPPLFSPRKAYIIVYFSKSKYRKRETRTGDKNHQHDKLQLGGTSTYIGSWLGTPVHAFSLSLGSLTSRKRENMRRYSTASFCFWRQQWAKTYTEPVLLGFSLRIMPQ